MRYDFGGGCRSTAYDDDITIVDIVPIDTNYDCQIDCNYGPIKKCKKNNIVADIFSDLALPEKANFINVSMVLRYFAGPDDGYLDSNTIDNKKLKQAGQNIIYNLLPNGIVRLYDHMPVLEDVIQELLAEDFEVVCCRMMQSRDRDYGAEWEVILK